MTWLRNLLGRELAADSPLVQSRQTTQESKLRVARSEKMIEHIQRNPDRPELTFLGDALTVHREDKRQ